MPEKKTSKQLQDEYANLAFKAGNLAYQIDCNSQDLNTLYATMKDINFQFIAAKNLEAQVADEVAKAKQAEEKPKEGETKNEA